jgi:hypothetical protein
LIQIKRHKDILKQRVVRFYFDAGMKSNEKLNDLITVSCTCKEDSLQ